MPTVNLDTAARLDIICRKGDSFELTVEFSNTEDLPAVAGDASYSMEVRTSDDNNAGGAFAALTVTRPEAKKLKIVGSPSVMNKEAGLYVYDIQYRDASSENASTTVTTYLFGTFEIKEDVTVNT
tara:strand:+ start:393 stop:767 length:375 start_codon:yes stop_codon:yes gene_type:complete